MTNCSERIVRKSNWDLRRDGGNCTAHRESPNYMCRVRNIINKCKDILIPFTGCQGGRDEGRMRENYLIRVDQSGIDGGSRGGMCRSDRRKFANAGCGLKRSREGRDDFCEYGFRDLRERPLRNVTSEHCMADRSLKRCESRKMGNFGKDTRFGNGYGLERGSKRIKRSVSKRIEYPTVTTKCLGTGYGNAKKFTNSDGCRDSGTAKQFLRNIFDSAFTGVEKSLKIKRDGNSEISIGNRSSSRSSSRHSIRNVHSRQSLGGFGKKTRNFGNDASTNDFSNVRLCRNADCPLARNW